MTGKPNDTLFSKIDKISNVTKDSEDIAEIAYTTKDKSLVSIHLDYLTRGYERFIKIYAENGNLVSSLSENYVKTSLLKSESKIKYFKDFSRNDMYNNMLISFIDCINNQTKPDISLSEGISSNEFAINLRDEYYEKINNNPGELFSIVDKVIAIIGATGILGKQYVEFLSSKGAK